MKRRSNAWKYEVLSMASCVYDVDRVVAAV